VRANHNRQTRRAAHCIRARSPRGHESASLPSGANRDDLAQVAARIAEELELSADAIDELLWGSAAPATTPGGDVRER
jgi:hypothetical protein